jgi:PiT family inorganic phosphate transporter
MPDLSVIGLIAVFVFAIALGFSNGFNDAANAVATAIGTRAISPRLAVGLAAVFNMLGAFMGLEVAKTIGKGILIPEAITIPTVIAGVASVVIWTTFATIKGLPVSITHGLVAGLAAAGVAAAGTQAIIWGVLRTIMAAVITAPLLGFVAGFVMMTLLYWLLRSQVPSLLRTLFSRLQVFSLAFVAYSHGKNDGQMPIGVITMALTLFYQDPNFWDRITFADPLGRWVIIISALSISLGTAIGGQRVIRTLGTKVTAMDPIQGFTAQTSAALVIEAASALGIPVSTTHCVSTSIMGVGATRRFSAVRWVVAREMTMAWIITFPACGLLGYVFSLLLGKIM